MTRRIAAVIIVWTLRTQFAYGQVTALQPAGTRPAASPANSPENAPVTPPATMPSATTPIAPAPAPVPGASLPAAAPASLPAKKPDLGAGAGGSPATPAPSAAPSQIPVVKAPIPKSSDAPRKSPPSTAKGATAKPAAGENGPWGAYSKRSLANLRYYWDTREFSVLKPTYGIVMPLNFFILGTHHFMSSGENRENQVDFTIALTNLELFTTNFLGLGLVGQMTANAVRGGTNGRGGVYYKKEFQVAKNPWNVILLILPFEAKIKSRRAQLRWNFVMLNRFVSFNGHFLYVDTKGSAAYYSQPQLTFPLGKSIAFLTRYDMTRTKDRWDAGYEFGLEFAADFSTK